jgi:hypothetical protein
MAFHEGPQPHEILSKCRQSEDEWCPFCTSTCSQPLKFLLATRHYCNHLRPEPFGLSSGHFITKEESTFGFDFV